MRRLRRKSREAREAQRTAEAAAAAESAEAAQSAETFLAEVPPDVELEEMEAPDEPRRLVLGRRLLPFVINWPATLMIGLLIVLTVFALLLNQGALPNEIVTWWPIGVAIPAGLWFLVALFRRDARSVLGSTALLGLSLSMLLAAQKVAPLGTTLVGITFIATGAGIMLRGLLLRNQPIGG